MKYDDIINLPHHQSKTRPQMPIRDRAAQFAPFAALKGYEERVAETARLTDEMMTLDENEITKLDAMLQFFADNLSLGIEVTVTHFVPDKWKKGGAYVEKTGVIKKIDRIEKQITFTDDEKIHIDKIISIE